MPTAKRSPITWTDFSGGPLNFVLRGTAPGDCEVSEGCAHCYARRILLRNGDRMPAATTFTDAKLKQLASLSFPEAGVPFRRGLGSRPMAFVCDMGDLFHPAVPDRFIKSAFALMKTRSDVDWQVLTKRASRLPEFFGGDILAGHHLPDNIWVGVTIENQRRHDERIGYLRQVPAAIRFLSIEPMLEPIIPDLRGISWVIVGGESGDQRRHFDKHWAETVRDACCANNTPFFFKQGSGVRPGLDDLLSGRREKGFPESAILAQPSLFSMAA